MNYTESTNKIQRIAIFGSTGSIGKQTLEVIEHHPNLFSVFALTAYSNEQLLIQQALLFKPTFVVIGDNKKEEIVKEALKNQSTQVLSGEEGLHNVSVMNEYDMALIAIIGFSAIGVVMEAIRHGKKIAIANKEVFVVAGYFITHEAKKNKATIIPIDSEHSSIFQCLLGESSDSIEKIILTSSGGPFRGKKMNFLESVKLHHALIHPNWLMGKKITIDSATMMNKGLEMIEAKWLFALSVNQIDVVIHPQQIIHSFVEFKDGSIKAQMSVPTMKIPIQYALTFPNRIKNNTIKKYTFTDYQELTFEPPDRNTFKALTLAEACLRKGDNASCCILNAANEEGVDAFINHKISFLKIIQLVEEALNGVSPIAINCLEDLFELDKITRHWVKDRIN